MIINPIYEVLLKKGRSDLKVALREFKSEDPELEIVCFHLQQFAEKYLKAFLYYNKLLPKKIHNLIYLLNECTTIDLEFEKFNDSKIIELNECGVEIRYEEISQIDLEFIRLVINDVLILKEFIENKIDVNKPENLF
jgi:HEPN domain-containing protein